jgi:hypothetical protein
VHHALLLALLTLLVPSASRGAVLYELGRLSPPHFDGDGWDDPVIGMPDEDINIVVVAGLTDSPIRRGKSRGTAFSGASGPGDEPSAARLPRRKNLVQRLLGGVSSPEVRMGPAIWEMSV